MNKQKTLIFSLSAILFLALSFIVYSWSEPTTNMPSGYTAPINTSITGQTKKGQLKLEGALTVPMIYDRDGCDGQGQNCPYYINPSGDSVVAGTISAANPTKNNHIATKEYIDGLIENIGTEVVSLANTTYISGINPKCPEDSFEIVRHWSAKHCGLVNQYKYYVGCTTGETVFWGGSAPSCSFNDGNYRASTHYCKADQSQGVLCGGLGQSFLVNKKHTESQCNLVGGNIVTVEGNVKICKFETQVCPAGWTQYKNWSTTQSYTMSYYGDCPCTTREHKWANISRESCSSEYYQYRRKPHYCPSPENTCDTNINRGSYLIHHGAEATRVTICGNATIKEIGCY